MNKGKQLIVALLILGVLAAAALLLWRDPFDKRSRPDYSGLLPFRPDGSIDRIVVTNKEVTITVEKRNGIWWITEPRELVADDARLKPAATALEIMVVVDTASQKPERQPEYGFAKAGSDRIEVKAFAGGKEVLNFAAGKRTPDGQGTFIVLTKDPNTVYVTSSPLPSLLGNGIMDWRSRLVLNLSSDTIDRVRMVNSQDTLEVVKESDERWRKQDDPTWHADDIRFGQVMGALSRLSWIEIVDEPIAALDYGFNTPQARVTATAGGKDHVLVFGKDVEGNSGNCWLKIEGDPRVYQVKKAILDRFTKDFDFYKGEPPTAGQEPPKKEN
jgi:hypothetical protein